MAFNQQLQKREKSFIPNEFDSIAISVASPEQILSWSYGEVTKPETINYRTQKPERDGLFCERIFGPTKNWECYCGKYKKLRFKNIICDRCGVEVTRSSVRRERMAHIKLAVPVTHIWYLRSTPSRMGLLLDLPVKTLDQVAYFASYIIQEVDTDQRDQAVKQLEQEYKSLAKKLREEYDAEKGGAAGAEDEKAKDPVRKAYDEKLTQLTEQFEKNKSDVRSIEKYAVISELKYRDLSMKFGHIFRAGIGAEALREIVEKIDLESMEDELAHDLQNSAGQKRKKIVRRLMLVGSLRKAGIRPEWMIMTVLPVIPPDLRPMVQLDGGRYAASDLNDLYRRIINRNNRLKRLLEIGAPEVICRNEKRMLQEAVDALINNSARASRAVTKTGNNQLQLKSLSDMLKGKQGRFRANLLGKRVDYSGRSVIVVGPSLKLNECGLPKKMALELFKPFVIGKLLKKEIAHNLKNAEKLIDQGVPQVWDVLEEVIQGHYVLLNRAPTLHRLGIQAFQPRLIEGKAIQLHPLVCQAFNADFDGDQMAVHVPLSTAAQKEAREIMASTLNLLKPSAGEAITTAQQDMVLGCYYLTVAYEDRPATAFAFADINEGITAYRSGFVTLQDRVKFRHAAKDGTSEIIETTVGRMIFNSFLPPALGYLNETQTKKTLEGIIAEAFEKTNLATTALLSDEIKRIGFKFATKSGISLGLHDFIVPKSKGEILGRAGEEVLQLNKRYRKGLFTDDERYEHTLKVWMKAKNEISDAMIAAADPHGSVTTMIASGARGNWGNIAQISGMKGLVANPAGRTIELPIKSNFKEGFTVLEYFIGTHAGRKGKSDTALKTANAGYLTRRLVDAVQDVIIREDDCGTNGSMPITRAESARIGEKFSIRIFGRTLAEDVADPKTGEILGEAGGEITRDIVKAVEAAKVERVFIRSVLTCSTEGGVCVRCYGRDLAKNQTVDVGTPVGIIAAQSIGEPGTQLTMRTFHAGGVADSKDITAGLPRVDELFEARSPKTPAIIAGVTGNARVRRKDQVSVVEITADELESDTYLLSPSMAILVKDGQEVSAKEVLAKAKDGSVLRTKEAGKVELQEDAIAVHQQQKLVKLYEIPGRESLKIIDNEHVEAGQALTEGHANLAELMAATSILTTQKYMMNEVQSIYASQGQSINDKHIEIIVRQMFSKSRILEAGDTPFLPGQVVDHLTLRKLNDTLRTSGKKAASAERLLLGLIRVSLSTDSWLSAASFQETIRVLVEASVTKRVDNLNGLKENVIIGKLIRAGKVYKREFYERKGLEMPEEAAPEPALVTLRESIPAVTIRTAYVRHRLTLPTPPTAAQKAAKKAKTRG